jgi:hypothetical protein
MLKGVEQTSLWTCEKIAAIKALMEHTTTYIRQQLPKTYSFELVQVIFEQPYCRITDLVQRSIAKRQTASVYLKQLAKIGVLQEISVGNELLLGVMAAAPATETQLMAVWDDFMMCKVLPRIEGDIDKLAIVDSAGNDGQETILSKLENLLSNQLAAVWQHTNRPDLYREPVDPKHEEILIACHSRQKLAWMRTRIESSGFTSFWP